MSTIQTPPRERLAIETVVTQDDDQTIRAAILHEMSRQGQVFFLHNRVQSIQVMLRRLQRIVPEAWISMAHGQMSENRLASIMRKFAEGRFHVLLCTTIIESGVDIPNVNTIIIDRADRFGLAELYQLRGRVGRSRNKAYAYLLVPGPRGLQDDARRRIQAIKHYSALGAGFKVALRDLEIRGAGNLLGSQQSGHIAAVGFDLYCQLLRRSIAVRQGERPPPLVHVDVHLDFIELSPRLSDSGCAVAIPYDYVEEEGQRVELYRRLASCTEVGEVRALREMMRDRFGALPPPAERMLLLAVLRIEAAQRHVQRVVVREGRIMLTRHDELLMEQHRFPSLVADESTGRIAELIEHVRALAP